MGMSNEEIAALMAEGEIAKEEIPTSFEDNKLILTQDEMDSLLSGFVSDDETGNENLRSNP